MDERRYRDVEERLWRSLGAEPSEKMLDVDLGGVRSIRVQELGDGPPLVMVHGGAICGASWAPLAVHLPGYRCILLDRPGCGLSPPIDRSFDDVDEFLTFAGGVVPTVLDALELDAAHLLCTSLGGLFGFHTTAEHASRVDRLVGIGSIFGSPMDNIPLIMRIGGAGPLPKLMAHMPANRAIVRAMLRQIGLKDALQAGRITREFEDWFLATIKYTDSTMSDATVAPSVISMRGMRPEFIFSPEMLGKIAAPTKLIWGESDPMAGVEVARAFADKLPDAELELWPNTGHAPWVDDPERAAASICDFLGN